MSKKDVVIGIAVFLLLILIVVSLLFLFAKAAHAFKNTPVREYQGNSRAVYK